MRTIVAAAGLFLVASCFAADLLPNGDFQSADGWPAANDRISYPREGENRFLRLTTTKPGETAIAYRQIKIPADVKALELTCKLRATDLKRGKQSWHDARILLQWKDAAGEKVAGKLPTPSLNRDADWTEKQARFLVPDGAVFLEVMPALMEVERGTLDVDDLSLHAIDPAPIVEVEKAAADAAAEKLAQSAAKRRANAAAKAGPDGELIANGDFQTDGKKSAPEHWGELKDDLSWQTEDDNRFLRLKSPAAGKMVLFYRAVDMPANTKAVELKWSQRVSDFKRGKENYFDARIMLQFLDAAGKKLTGEPSPPATNKNTEGWVERQKSFLVPDDALAVVLMPCLFQVESGTFDLDNLSLKAVDPAPLLAVAEAKAAEELAAIVPPETPQPAKFPAELHVVGNKVLDRNDREVWLQGVNIDSLQWNPRGERVLRSAVTALEDWNANLLRLPIQETYWFGRDASQKDEGRAYRELVDQVVTLAANRGKYVLIDLHRFRAPKRQHVELWKDVATKYKNHPAVIFELFNEPHGISWKVWRDGGFVEDKNAPADEDAFLTPEEKALNAKGFHSVGVQALVDAVRDMGAKNVVVCGGLDWAYDLSGVADGYALDERGGNGLIYSTHIYAQKRDWAGKVLIVADKYPLIVSELGANTKKFGFMPAESQEDADTWVPRMLGFIQQRKLHWTAFSFHPGSAPMLISDWKYTPTPEWGAPAKRALAGETFPPPTELR